MLKLKPSEMLDRIGALLSNESVKLEQMTLDNGTVIEAEMFEAGQSVFIVTEDEQVALPIGEYTLEDGRVITVEEEGIIAAIGEPQPVEEEMSEEVVYATKEEVDEIKSILSDIRASLELKATEKEEMLTALSSLKEQLEEPAAKPFKHSPEKEEKQVRLGNESITEFLNNRKK